VTTTNQRSAGQAHKASNGRAGVRRSADTRRKAVDDYNPGAVGVLVTAGVLMVLTGLFQAAQGLVALVSDEFYVVGQEYVFQLDLTTWGWVHLVLGIVLVLGGVGLFSGATSARVLAVVLASFSIMANFLWMPHYPWWSLTIIAFDLFVIWAATAHGRDILAH
jgi:hypothetical protein